MKKMWNVFLAMSRSMLLGILGIVAVIFLMFFQLESLTPGINQTELDTYNSARSVSAIIDNPVNAPYKIAVIISTQVLDSIFGLRLVGALVGVISVVLFFLISRKLFSLNIAVAATAMFSTSTLMLVSARSATAQIMILSLLSIIAVGYYIRFGKRKDIGWIVAAIILGLSIYVPGIVLLLIPGVIWQFKQIRKSFESLKPPIIIASSVIFGVLCVPLFISIVREPSLWQGYLGLPESVASLGDIARQTGRAFLSIFALAPNNPSFWLGRQPILDVFAVAMFIYGLVSLIGKFKLDRFWIIVGSFILGLIWVGATSNSQGLILLLPLIYVVIGFGLQRFINQWLRVFPKNPIARYAGSLLLAVAIIISINFQLQRYFSAWPNSDAAKEALSYQLDGSYRNQ